MLKTKTITLLLSFATCLSLFGQLPETDKSPLDFSYAPYNFPILKFQGKTKSALPLARIIYSRPQKNGRSLFGGEIKYHELWRLGANEATELELFRPATIAGKNIPKGRYTLYCIPESEKWLLIISKDNYSWGAFSYKQVNDVARVSVPVTHTSGPLVEYFTMYFNEENNLMILWDDVRVVVPFVFNPNR